MFILVNSLAFSAIIDKVLNGGREGWRQGGREAEKLPNFLSSAFSPREEYINSNDPKSSHCIKHSIARDVLPFYKARSPINLN